MQKNVDTLDEIDLKILRILQKNAKLTTKELADTVSLTPTPVFERQKRLERQGYIKKYIAVSRELGIRYRVLVVMTDIPSPTVELDPSIELRFLGYDYAYEAPDNYSAVYNEIPFVFTDIKLNENGLIETREEMDTYLKKREEFVKSHPPYTLEVGDFTVFKLYEMNI